MRKIFKAIGTAVAKLPSTKIGGAIGKVVSTKAGGVVDQVATGGIFSAIFKPTPESPVGSASPAAWARAISQVIIINYLVFYGDIDKAILFLGVN